MTKLTTAQVKEEANRFIDGAMKAIRPLIIGGEGLPPAVLFMLHFPEHDEIEFYPVPKAHIFFESDESKDALPFFIRIAASTLPLAIEEVDGKKPEFSILAVILASDAYISQQEVAGIKEGGVVRASRDPNRKEAILFTISLEDGDYIRSFPYSKTESGIQFDQATHELSEDDIKGITGRFANLFPHGIR